MSTSRTRHSTADSLAALTLLHRFSVQINLVASAALPLGQTVPNVDIQVLRAVAQERSMSPTQVAEATGRPRSTLSRSIARLTAAGLMERHRNDADGRSADLRLTSSGRSQVAGFAEAMSDFFVEIQPTAKDYLTLVDRVHDGDEGAGPSDAVELASSLARAGSAYVAELRPRLRPLRVENFRDRHALLVVALHGQVRPGQLADELGLSASGVSTLARRLESRGLVARHAGIVADDARSVIVQLTPSGSRAVRVCTSVFPRYEPALSDAMTGILTYRR